MSHLPKRPRLTYAQTEIEDLEIEEAPVDEAEDEETASASSCSFTFSYPSLSSSSTPVLSPVMFDSPEEEEKKEGEEQEEEREEGEKDQEEGESQEEGNNEERDADQMLSSSPSPQIIYSYCAFSSSTSNSSSIVDTEKPTRMIIHVESLHVEPLEEKVAELVHFMINKYRLRKVVTKEEMLQAVIKNSKFEFSVVFEKACKSLGVISGIDVKEVDPPTNSYVLVNSLDITYDEMLSDDQIVPRNGLLMMILGVIFTQNNCASEAEIWDFLIVFGVHPDREHLICGETRKLVTEDWVREEYLVYQQVPDNDSPCCKYYWGPRAYAETSKLKVLQFLVKIKATDPLSFYFLYKEALRDEHELDQATHGPMDLATTRSIEEN